MNNNLEITCAESEGENQKGVYNLSKLKILIVGMIIPIIWSIPSAFFDSIVMGCVDCVVQLVCWILLLVGIQGVRNYSDRFMKAYNTAKIVTIAFVVACIFVLGLICFQNVESGMVVALLTIIPLIVLCLVFLAGIAQIYFYYSILKAIEDLAMTFKEDKLAVKCDKLWMAYIWLFILGLTQSFFLIILPEIVANIIIWLYVIATIVINLMIVQVIYQAYSRFNGKELNKIENIEAIENRNIDLNMNSTIENNHQKE